MHRVVIAGVLVGGVLLVVLPPLHAQQEMRATPECTGENLHCITKKITVGSDALASLPEVSVEVPESTKPLDSPKSTANRTVTYSVETKGAIRTSPAEFKSQSNQSLNDPRGWARLGLTFTEVDSAGDFTLVLSEASQVPTFAPGACDTQYSCRVGRFIIINEDRWLGATDPWNAAGGSLRDYRHMVINHETGHWLGHGHSNCRGAGQAAAVMQQQSIDLQGCTFNPWPLDGELHAPGLGI